MVLYDGLDTLIQSTNTPRLDLVFVHSLGLGPETTWHDDSSGKNWIEEADFVLGLGWRVRVMSFRYNSDIASNMSAASIAIHANDLLYHLEKAMAKSDNIGLFFIAHGLGGAIVKKALRVRDLASNCPRVRDASTGVVFFGTPHVDTSSEALLQTVRNTVQLLRHDHHTIDDDDVRHFAAAVSSVNSTFISTKPKALQSISYWEEEESLWKSADGDECSGLIVPKSCQKPELWNNLDISIGCKYLDLPHFPSMFDTRFTKFINDFTGLVNRVLEHKTVVIKPVKLPSAESPTAGHGTSSTRKRGRRTRSGRARSARGDVGTDDSDTEDEHFTSWQKRKQYEEDRTRLDSFLQSLRGWSDENTGHDVFVATGTCDWILASQALSMWLDFATYGTFFWLAEPGSGKTHVAKALATHIEKTNTKDIVLTFFCGKNERAPCLWDYFTWSLLQARPSLFTSVPKRHQGRDEDSEPLSLGDFVDIWASLRQCEADDDTKDTVWLVIDGLEACGDEIFLQFWNSLEQLRKRQVDSKKPLALLKVLFTGTLTPAMIAVAGGVSRYSVSPDLIKQDIARYVDTRLNRCIDSESLLDIKDNVENLRQEIKEGSSDYWPFARDATAEVELMLGRNLAKVASFTGRLPRKLEMHLQQTLVSLRQSIGSSRYLYPLLIILVSNQGGPELNIYQLKDALSSLYSANEVQKLDLADLVLRHCGGLLTWTGTGSLYFRHSGFVDSLGQKVTDARRKANLAYVCMTYLLQDHFKAMPLPANFKDPLVWLNENHPFYAYAVENCLEFVAAAGGDDGRLPPLFLRLFLEDCPQWKMAREWIKVCPSYQSPYEDFETLAIMPIIRDERLLPILERVCPPPPDLTEFSLVQRTKHQLRAWCRPAGNHMPQFALPKEWLKARTDREHTPLLAAARQGNVNAVRYILKWHPNVNERGGPDMRSILMMLYCSQSFGTPEERSTRLTAITSDLLQRGADLNLGDKRGSCPLHVACDQASLPLTRLLLDNGADINVSDQDGCTAWQIACERRFPDLLGELVERDVEVDSLFDSGETALTYLTRCGWLKCLRVVVPKADVNIIDRTGVAPIHRAVQVEANRYEILELLISKPGINLDALQSRVFGDNNPERATALLIAITANDHRAAEMLLRAGASSHYMPGLEVLPLELAVRRGNRAIVELLLRHRAPVNEFLITRRKQTALSTAATACSVDMLKLLLDYGADPTIEDGLQLPNAAQLIVESKSPNVDALKLLLDCPNPPAIVQSQSFAESEHVDYSEIFIKACSIKETQFVRALLDHGVELSTWLKLPEQFSPLHAAVRSGNLEVCHILLEKEPRFLNMFCRCGSNMFSPLHEACCTGQLEIAKFLLEQGADVKLLTPHEERSCLLLACTFSSPEMVEVILAADPSMADVPSFTGSSPLQHSSGRGQVKVTEELIKAGASLSKWHLGRYSCISRTVFHMMGPLAIPMVRLYVKHGLDINVPITAFGHTTFHCAIGAGHPAVIRWMHAQGGNGIRTCRISEKSEVWELGLRAMGQNMSPEVIEMLLASNRETLADMDWSRQNALGSFSFGRKAYLSRLHWLCEEIRADTSQDIFAAMMVEPDLFGITPLDRSIGIRKCRPESHARVAKVTLAFIESYLEMPNWALLGEIKMLLTAKLEYYIPEDLAPVMTLHYSVPGLKTLPDGQVEQSSTTHSRRCLTCRWPIFERCSFCIKCELASCSACLGGDKQPPCERAEKHLWVAFALDSTVSVQSVEVQAAFGRIKAALLRKSEDLQDGLRDSSIAVSVKEDDGDETNHLQSSLQLATLHAFNMLAIRRSIGTIYLPLSVHAIKLISPFQGHIAEMRKFHERKMLDEESTLERRMEEMRYMSSAMGRMAYADEGLFRQDMVLGEMARLFSETVTA